MKKGMNEMPLYSKWGEAVNLAAPLPEYPRMTLQRNSFYNLNGEWEYQILQPRQMPVDNHWKKIVVPFALGCALSQTNDVLMPGEVLWYRKVFRYRPEKKHTLLNFEAVDQRCEVYLNGHRIGSHDGGYTPFSIEATNFLEETNELLVSVIDDSDESAYAYGKQRIRHGGMWYAPTSGIWQTVWLEDVGDQAILDIKVKIGFDERKVTLYLRGLFDKAKVIVSHDGRVVYEGIAQEKKHEFILADPHPWTPDDPFLYDLFIQTEDDLAKSYFGFRKFSRRVDKNGFPRFCLNNKPLFFTGLLDQGYSVDGMYTYPSDGAITYELGKIKDMGFNMLRKHVKVECRRWYYHCDRLGILVMQDMPNGAGPYDLLTTKYLPNIIGFTKMDDHDNPRLGRDDPEEQKIYYHELDEMIATLSGYTSIFCWVAFNEGWGQFEGPEVTEHIRSLDDTRLIDTASGWHDQGCGDFYSRHMYFSSNIVPKRLDHRILILSEFGGYSYLDPAHSEATKLYGYRKYKDREEMDAAFHRFYDEVIIPSIREGLSGCIYTQVADVGDECNGLFTADRKVIKVNEEKTRTLNERCIRRLRTTRLMSQEDR